MSLGVVQPEDKKVSGRPYCNLSVIQGSLEERRGQTFEQGLL